MIELRSTKDGRLWDPMNRSVLPSLKNGNGSLPKLFTCSWPTTGSMLTNLLLHPRLLLTLALSMLLLLAVVAMWTRYSAFYNVRWHPTDSRSAEIPMGSINYGIVIDAGSSSSKVYLFQWPTHDGDPTKLLKIKPLTDELDDPLTSKVEPGISTFGDEPERASESLQPLLEFASSHIPVSKHYDTSLYILCTAGMRLLSGEAQDRIILHLQERVTREWPFRLPKDGIQVISGKLEGVFSWITVNYLLGRFDHNLPPGGNMEPAAAVAVDGDGGNQQHQLLPLGGPDVNRTVYTITTVGSLDMGGASLQVAFEIPHNVEVSEQTEVVEVNLGCGIHDDQHRHRVHVSTYLGYGTNEARARYYHLLVKQHMEESGHNHSIGGDLPSHPAVKDPCMPLGMEENVTVDYHVLKVRGLGDFSGCKRALLPILLGASDSEGEEGEGGEEWGGGGGEAGNPSISYQQQLAKKLQAFHRPTVSVNYESMEFYGTSEFWYTMRDVLRLSGDYTAKSFKMAAGEFCRTPWKVLMDRFMKKLYTFADLYRLRSQCMKSAWVSLVLHEGLGFPEDTISLQSTGSIYGQSVQWPLGALLYHTRYLPLREVQLQQLKSPIADSNKTNSWTFHSLIHSSFALPLLVVLSVIVILVACRRRRPSLRTYPSSSQGLTRSVSQGSFLKLHRRTSSVNNQLSVMGSLSRNTSSNRLSAIV